ncbi:MAG: hypothetical protein ACYCWE_21070 [Eubacteriales bacterium]
MPAKKSTFTPEEASQYLAERGISLTAQDIRAGLIQERRALDFGFAIEMNKNYIYRISVRQLTEWADRWLYNSEAS